MGSLCNGRCKEYLQQPFAFIAIFVFETGSMKWKMSGNEMHIYIL